MGELFVTSTKGSMLGVRTIVDPVYIKYLNLPFFYSKRWTSFVSLRARMVVLASIVLSYTSFDTRAILPCDFLSS